VYVLIGLTSLVGVAFVAPLAAQSAGPDSLWLASKSFFTRHAQGDALLSLTRADIFRIRPDGLTDLLRRAPAVRVRRTASRDDIVLERPAGTGDAACTVEIWLNAHLVEAGPTGRALRVDQLIHATQIDGLELHEREAGPLATEACATLLIWSARLRNATDGELTGALRGRVVNAYTNAPVADVRITLSPGGAAVATDRDGRFAFDSLPAGRYEIIAELGGRERYRDTVRVRAFGVVMVDLRIEYAGAPRLSPLTHGAFDPCHTET
jgi:hypothetical protein